MNDTYILPDVMIEPMGKMVCMINGKEVSEREFADSLKQAGLIEVKESYYPSIVKI